MNTEISNVVEKKSICFLTTALVMGGVENVLIDTIEVLKDEYDITVFSIWGIPYEGILAKFPKDITILAPNLPVQSKKTLIPYLSKFHYQKFLKGKKFDYLISTSNDILNSCYIKEAKYHIFWQFSDHLHKYTEPKELTFLQKIKRIFLKKVYNKYDEIWTVCDQIREDYIKGFKLKNVKTLPNPINCQRIIQKAEEECEVVFPKGKLNIVLLGRFGAIKGFDRVLRAIGEMSRTKSLDLHLWMIGSGEDESLYKNIIEEYNLTQDVTILGLRHNPFPYLKQADLFVCPSRSESFGLVMMEALTLQIPVITTATAGGLYVTQDGKYGICVPNDDQAVLKGLEEYITEKSKYPCDKDTMKSWAWQHDLKFFQEKIKKMLKDLAE